MEKKAPDKTLTPFEFNPSNEPSEKFEQEYYKRKNGTTGVRTINTLRSMTDQSFKDQCDVNNIVKRYEQTGQMPHVTRAVGQYMDSTELQDYSESMQRVLNANDAFLQLPATIRDRFANDPAKLIEFMQNPQNYDEGVKLGLVAEKVQTKTQGETKRDQREQQTPAKNEQTKPATSETKPERE